MIECMLDLETWGLPPNGMIVSIGATKFNSHGILDRLHLAIDPETYPQHLIEQFAIAPSTMRWWLDPARDAARVEWHHAPKVDIATALDGFAMWFKTTELPAKEPTEDRPFDDLGAPEAIWGNAASFDITLLKHAYEVFSQEIPWNFRGERCHRTLKTLVPKAVEQAAWARGAELVGEGIAHTALYDAEVQTWQNLGCRHWIGASKLPEVEG